MVSLILLKHGRIVHVGLHSCLQRRGKWGIMILVKKIGFALLWVIAVLTVFVACIPIGCRMAVGKLKQKLTHE
jgi:hypothetical protein